MHPVETRDAWCGECGTFVQGGVPGGGDVTVHTPRRARDVVDKATAIAFVKKWADETFNIWDAGLDHKAGKNLKAMSGRLKGFTAQITAFLEGRWCDLPREGKEQ